MLKPFNEWRHGNIRQTVLQAAEPLIPLQLAVHTRQQGTIGNFALAPLVPYAAPQ